MFTKPSEKADLDAKFHNLEQFVKANKLPEIKAFIDQEKERNKYNWNENNIIKCAVRDAVLAGQVEVVRLFLEERFGIDTDVHIDNSRTKQPLFFLIENVQIIKHPHPFPPRKNRSGRGEFTANFQ